MDPLPILDVDPFDLPEWLGVSEVSWQADAGLRTGHHVVGAFRGPDGESLACDLLAVDRAFPVRVTDEQSRVRSHQTWHHGEVLVGSYDDRLVLAVPGDRFTADLVLEAVSRLARAVGASPERYVVHLRIGARNSRERATRG